MSGIILHIAIPVPVNHYFDYLLPDAADLKKLQPGVRIKVPWGKQEAVGILLSVSRKSEIPLKKLKKIIEILDEEPLFSEPLLALIKFGSEYYHHAIGEVFEAAMPVLLRQGKSSAYRQGYTEEFEDLPEAPSVLNPAQQSAVEKILSPQDKFNCFLLFGVTGSGKTEVYLQVIDKILAQQKQALILVPEIGLTPQTIARFERRFLVRISVLHSGLTDRERHDSWMQAKNGDAKIIIGTRSAIFTPLKNPGVIIVDEEHDLSYKQQEGLKYCARDLAVMRGHLENIPVILGSATPSLESFYNARINRYILLSLPERAGQAMQPVYCLMDMKNQPKKSGRDISPALIQKIQHHLSQQGQVLIFLNRRGFAPVLMCHQCGWIADCQRCDARMTLHQYPAAYLQCHHCLSQRSVDKICADCGEAQLLPTGAGTQRLEEALEKYFPDTPIIRIDRDTTRKKGTLKTKLTQIQQNLPCILVGTQMLAKGHHFPAVSLSVMINIDGGLFSTDFRGMERTAQLILQVGGRAGRVEKQGEVILQTLHADHVLLNLLLEKGYLIFADAILKEREAAGLPPYQFLVLIRAESVNIDFSMAFLSEVKKLLEKQSSQDNDNSNVSINGPIPAPMQKKAGKHRAQLLLQSLQRKHLKYLLNHLENNLSGLKYKSRVRWSIDVDPQEIF